MPYFGFLHFASLQSIAGLHHAITTRTGGASGRQYSSLNLGYHVGDNAATVTENRRRLAESLGYDGSTLVAAQQVHGAQVHIVEQQDRGRGSFGWDDAIEDIDALIVADSQTPVLILVADCAPLLLVDREHHVFAVVHAGWRGAVAGIGAATVAQMQQRFRTDAHAIQVGIGPCLCVDCFEIGPEVASAVESVAPNAVVTGDLKPHLDLRAVLHCDLQRAGVTPEHIETLADCPRCQPERFFSHRGQEGTAGRFGLVAWWE